MPRMSPAVERIPRADVITRFRKTTCVDTSPRQPALIRWPGIHIIPPPEMGHFSRNDFSLLVLRLGAGRPTRCGGPAEQGCCSAETTWRATGPLLLRTAIAARGRETARRGEMQIAKCKMQIANCSRRSQLSIGASSGHLFSIFNFQFAIFNLLSLSLLLLFAAPAAAQVQLPELSAAEPISITAQAGNQWQLGSYEVWVLRGNCVIQQGQWLRPQPRGRLVDRPGRGHRAAAEQGDRLPGRRRGSDVGPPAERAAVDRPDVVRPLLQQCRRRGPCRNGRGQAGRAAADLLAGHGAAEPRAGRQRLARSV